MTIFIFVCQIEHLHIHETEWKESKESEESKESKEKKESKEEQHT
jgi:hypothetical protein